MNVPNLSRRLATRIIEGLRGRGRIVVVRGGTSALVRVIDDVITTFVASINERFEHEHSPELDHNTREFLTLLAAAVARTLFSSEHLEDVFADRSIVEREVFDTALQTFSDETAAQRANVIVVEFDTLGYVAATAARLASEECLIDALECAANSLGVKLSRYDAELREAIFIPEDEPSAGSNIWGFGSPSAPFVPNPDLRLELEEAVAEELSFLVTQGTVSLPVIERTRTLGYRVDASLQTKLARTIDRLAACTLRRTGCAASWEFLDDARMRVHFTPLSEQDARDVDAHVTEFVTEVDTILAHAGGQLVTHPVALPAADIAVRYEGNGPVEEVKEAEPESVPEPRVTPQRTPRTGMRAKSTPRVASKRVSTKRATKRKEAPAPEKSGTRKKASLDELAAVTKKKSAAKKG